MRHKNDAPVRRDWLSKTLAGFVLGAVLAFCASALFSVLNGDMPLAVRGQLTMWMIPPIWIGILGGVYFFTSGVRAWLWLGVASVLACGLLVASRIA